VNACAKDYEHDHDQEQEGLEKNEQKQGRKRLITYELFI
jgi:hypothetical protein